MNIIFRQPDETEGEPEGIEKMNNDYTGDSSSNDLNSTSEESNEVRTSSNTNTRNEPTIVTKLSLLNMFEKGSKKMIDLNIPKMRERKKD